MAVLFALLAGLSFGALPMSVRYGLERTGDVGMGVVVQAAGGLVVCGAVALVRGQFGTDVAPFLLIGLLVPGVSNLLLTRAVLEAGPSRVSVIMNTYPLLAVVFALLLLGEPLNIVLLAGAVLIVIGAVVLASESVRPDYVKRVGFVLAVATSVLFAVRDLTVRWLALDASVAPQLAGAATLIAATAVGLVIIGTESHALDWKRRVGRGMLPYAPSGMLLGLAYIAMFEAFFRGRVGVVSPLVATAAFWGILLPGLLLRRVELVGRHLVLGAAFIVSGGALIGIFR